MVFVHSRKDTLTQPEILRAGYERGAHRFVDLALTRQRLAAREMKSQEQESSRATSQRNGNPSCRNASLGPELIERLCEMHNVVYVDKGTSCCYRQHGHGDLNCQALL